MSDILITSEYFGKFSPEARELLCKAGHRVIDNPYGHKALTPEEIIPYAAKADAMTACFSEYSRKVLDKAKSRHPTIPEQMKRAEQQLAKEKPPKEHIKEVTHGDR